MANNRNRPIRKRYPGRGKRYGAIRDPLLRHSSTPPIVIESNSHRLYTVDSVPGGRCGNRPIMKGNRGYVNVPNVTGSRQDGNGIARAIGQVEIEYEFNIKYGLDRNLEAEPWGIIFDENRDIIYQGRAKEAPGYARGIFAILRWLAGDEAGPWTRKPFYVTRGSNGEYFFKEKWVKVEGEWLENEKMPGDMLVRPGSKGWAVEGFEQLKKGERYQPVAKAGKEGEAAEKAQSTAYGTSLDFEDKARMSADFSSRFDS